MAIGTGEVLETGAAMGNRADSEVRMGTVTGKLDRIESGKEMDTQ